jgi:hypothetical protein
MDYVDFINGITFRFIKPHTPWALTGYANLLPWLRLGTSLEFSNTKIQSHEREMKRNLQKICNIPRMSTFAIGAIINRAVYEMQDGQAFVNVGVWHGFTLLSGIANNAEKRCIGVDNFSEYGSPRKAFLKRFNDYRSVAHSFYEMDYLDYFQGVHKEEIGFYIYDGNHTYENQLSGLKAAEPFLCEKGMILIDDANYSGVRQVTKQFISESSNEYRILFDRATYSNYHPTFWNGIIIIQKVKA